MAESKKDWIRVLADAKELPPGRVTTVTAGHRSLALSNFEGKLCALDNRCPHQGGPLGEGSIENGWLRCPWHGWDYHPCTGKPPGGFDDGVDTFPVEERADGVYVGVPAEALPTRTVSDVMVETMVNWGITHVFGMVGHSNLGLAEALRRAEEGGHLKFIGIRHEGAAAFAASAYAKLTGNPAACLAIAGPGATNLMTGLWDAKVDRAPILALTGQVDTQVLGPGAFQEVDLAAAFSAVARWSQTVLSGSRHAELMSLAMKSAIVERDVAHLIFPDEVQTLPSHSEPSSSEGRIGSDHISAPEESISEALHHIRQAKRPIVVVGHGARFNGQSVLAFAETLGAPILTTFKAKGLVADDHPLAAGVLGRSGTPIASWFMNECDLMIVLGASFSNHTGLTPKKTTIHVDFDRMALGKFHGVDVPVWGEISTTLHRLKSELKGHTASQDQRGELAERWKIWRAEKERRAADDRGEGLNSAAVFAALQRHISPNAVISVDVGNNTYSFGRYFECQQQSVLMSGYLGSIGFGFPGAMGAWAAAPDREIVAITGDGGFGQYLAEMTTAVKYKMPIRHILLNNHELGKISKEQRAGEWDVWQTSLHNPNFSKFAENCGALGVRVESMDALDDGLARVFAHDGPAMLEIMTDALLV